MFCLCMCALMEFIKVFCIVLHILTLIHCFLYPSSQCNDVFSGHCLMDLLCTSSKTIIRRNTLRLAEESFVLFFFPSAVQ